MNLLWLATISNPPGKEQVGSELHCPKCLLTLCQGTTASSLAPHHSTAPLHPKYPYGQAPPALRIPPNLVCKGDFPRTTQAPAPSACWSQAGKTGRHASTRSALSAQAARHGRVETTVPDATTHDGSSIRSTNASGSHPYCPDGGQLSRWICPFRPSQFGTLHREQRAQSTVCPGADATSSDACSATKCHGSGYERRYSTEFEPPATVDSRDGRAVEPYPEY